MTNEHQHQDHTTLVTFLCILLGVMALSVWMVGPFILTVVMGGILAILVWPLYRWLLTKKFRPQGSTPSQPGLPINAPFTPEKDVLDGTAGASGGGSSGGEGSFQEELRKKRSAMKGDELG